MSNTFRAIEAMQADMREVLGYTYEDKVTRFIGVATAIQYSITGVVQLQLSPGCIAGQWPIEPRWFEIGRLMLRVACPQVGYHTDTII